MISDRRRGAVALAGFFTFLNLYAPSRCCRCPLAEAGVKSL